MTLKLAQQLSTALLVVLLAASACSGTDDRSQAFCDTLAKITGPSGVESALAATDPGRIDGVVDELAELHEQAPEEISATTRTLLTFFRSYQRAARDERRDVIAANEQTLTETSAALDKYALDTCGLFLQRVPPTPRPTPDASIEAPITD